MPNSSLPGEEFSQKMFWRIRKTYKNRLKFSRINSFVDFTGKQNVLNPGLKIKIPGKYLIWLNCPYFLPQSAECFLIGTIDVTADQAKTLLNLYNLGHLTSLIEVHFKASFISTDII